MLHDVRHAVRLSGQSKGWTAVVLVSLALGIGANAALFSAVNGLLLSTLSVPSPDELVRFRWVGENHALRNVQEYGFVRRAGDAGRGGATFSYGMFEHLKSESETLEGLFAAAPYGRVNVVVEGEAEVASAFVASGSYFEVLGVRPAAGRAIGPADEEPAAPPAVMISHAFWTRRFGRDPNVLGKTIRVNDLPVTIVGVTPESYAGIQTPGGTAADVHLPLMLDVSLGGGRRLSDPTYWWLQIMARRKPGVTELQVLGNLDGAFQAAARAGIDLYLQGLTSEERQLSRNQGRTSVPRLSVESGRRGVYDPSPTTTRDVFSLGVVVSLMLLIVCANVATLLLSRTTARRGEIVVRLSMGATRGRLVRQLLTEGLLLSAVGGALGMVVAHWGRRLLPYGQGAPLDARVLLFVLLLIVATGCIFSLFPALRATRPALAASMMERGRRVHGSKTVIGRGLLALQIAVCLVLLTGSGVFLKTLRNLRGVDVGFDPTNLLLFRLDPASARYDESRIPQFYEEVRERLAGLGGVRSVSFSQSPFLSGGTHSSTVYFSGSAEDGVMAYTMTVSPEFFETLGIGVLAGRALGAQDGGEAPRVAVISSSGARELVGEDENPLGSRFGFSPEERNEIEIVGVVEDVKYETVRGEAPPTLYFPYGQRDPVSMTFEVKTARRPLEVVPDVRQAIRSLDPSVPLMDVSTQEEQIENRLTQERTFTLFYSLFGGLAMLLAAVGLFGLTSYEVGRRTNEIGIRMALGARPSDVLCMVAGDSAKIVLVGIGVGIAASLAAGRMISSLLFGVEPTDASTILTVVFLLVLTAALAAFLPAQRAARVDPAAALQDE